MILLSPAIHVISILQLLIDLISLKILEYIIDTRIFIVSQIFRFIVQKSRHIVLRRKYVLSKLIDISRGTIQDRLIQGGLGRPWYLVHCQADPSSSSLSVPCLRRSRQFCSDRPCRFCEIHTYPASTLIHFILEDIQSLCSVRFSA